MLSFKPCVLEQNLGVAHNMINYRHIHDIGLYQKTDEYLTADENLGLIYQRDVII